MHRLLRTLPTTAKALSGSKELSFGWGLPLDFVRHRILEVAHSLLPGTSVHCLATAQKTTTEVSGGADVGEHFRGGAKKGRFPYCHGFHLFKQEIAPLEDQISAEVWGKIIPSELCDPLVSTLPWYFSGS